MHVSLIFKFSTAERVIKILFLMTPCNNTDPYEPVFYLRCFTQAIVLRAANVLQLWLVLLIEKTEKNW